MKSGLGKIFLKFLLALTMLFLLLSFNQKYKFSDKNGERMEEFQKYFSWTTFHHLFQARNATISPIFHFDRGNNGRICHNILCVKLNLIFINVVVSFLAVYFIICSLNGSHKNVSYFFFIKIVSEAIINEQYVGVKFSFIS